MGTVLNGQTGQWDNLSSSSGPRESTEPPATMSQAPRGSVLSGRHLGCPTYRQYKTNGTISLSLSLSLSPSPSLPSSGTECQGRNIREKALSTLPGHLKSPALRRNV